MNPVLQAPPLRLHGCLSQPRRTASTCLNLTYRCSARELRTEKRCFFAPCSNNSAAGELLSPALPKWVSVECSAALAKLQGFEWIRSPTITMLASGLSSNKKARGFLSAAAASLSSASPEEDSASGSSKGLGSKIVLNLPRRRLQVSFTCDACGARSQRLINPHAYVRGTVFVQCSGCEVYHKLVDNLGLIEEYDFREETNSKVDGVDLSVLE